MPPELRFPNFKETWLEYYIGDLCQIKTGNKDTQDSLADGDYPFFVRSDEVRRINTFSFDGPSILTSGDGAGVGKIYHYIDGKYDYHQRVYALRNFIENIDIKFVYYFFSDRFMKRVYRLSAKNSVDSVRMDMISEMEIRIPSLPEQQKIASFLTSVDKRISQLKRKKQLLEQYKKGIMQQIFPDTSSGQVSQELRFKREDGSNYPDWDYIGGGELFSNISNKNHESDLPILAITQEFGAIPRELIDYEINVTTKSVSSYKVVEKGDFIISLRSFQGGIEYSNYKGICSPAYIILKPKVELERGLYKQYFKSYNYIIDLNRKLEGIRDGKMISYRYFSEIKLPVPCLEEQTKIANFLSAIDNKISQTQQQIVLTQQFKKGLLQQMFV